MNAIPPWASEALWRKLAIVITAVAFLLLIILTFDSLSKISAGSQRVPPYSVINQRIDYRFDPARKVQVPVIGGEQPLFGQRRSEAESAELVSYGKKIVQGRNCMNCHTLLGNGAYYAPDLTKSWLDPAWGNEQSRERLMLLFLQDPLTYARTFGSGRRMPDLKISEQEAVAIIAFLKWMAAIDTNGFPYGFKTIPQGGAS